MRSNYKGGNPLALESTMNEYLKNKQYLDKMFGSKKGRKVNLFEESDLLSEDNIKGDLD